MSVHRPSFIEFKLSPTLQWPLNINNTIDRLLSERVPLKWEYLVITSKIRLESRHSRTFPEIQTSVCLQKQWRSASSGSTKDYLRNSSIVLAFAHISRDSCEWLPAKKTLQQEKSIKRWIKSIKKIKPTDQQTNRPTDMVVEQKEMNRRKK